MNIRNKFWDYVNLSSGEEDKQKVLEAVTASISFKGSNLWILACAILIASVGLNVNSAAVIIGAMLISPLMGPIVGAGFALGTYNSVLLRKSIKNLGIATVVSLAVSAFYFYLSPFKEMQSELLARTSPTIYDVLIAFFGGLVGVIAITRVEKGNPIPGVAIATALMPPLCTAGYGLATFNISYFLGAFYLYTINCFFICIATFLVIKYLSYPASEAVNPKNEKRIRVSITILIFVMIIPSFYLAYNLFQEKKFTSTVEDFIQSEFGARGYTVVYKKLNYATQTIDLAFLNKKLTTADMEMYNRLLKERGLGKAALVFRQEDADLKTEILKELGQQSGLLTEKDIQINSLQRELEQYQLDDQGLVAEIGILFPDLKKLSLGKLEKLDNGIRMGFDLVLLYESSEVLDAVSSQKLEDWLRNRLAVARVILVHQPEQLPNE